MAESVNFLEHDFRLNFSRFLPIAPSLLFSALALNPFPYLTLYLGLVTSLIKVLLILSCVDNE